MIGSRKCMFGFAMSILARSTMAPSSISPLFIFLNKVQAFFDRTVAVGLSTPGWVGVSFLGGNLFGSLFVNICFPFLDEADREIPQLLEVVGCVIFISPLVAQPLDILLDGFYVFHIFLGRVGVVET